MSIALAEIELPIRLRTDCPMSDDQFMRFCAANEPMQFEREANGEIIVMSPTGTGGGRIETRVNLELGDWARADGRGETCGPTTGFKLPDSSVRAADAAWMSFLRWNALDAEELKRFARACPEFVIEVRSETDRLAELQEKMRMWVANGAELAWLIDPSRRVVEVYRLGEEPDVLMDPSSVQGSGVVVGFELVMVRVWG